MSPITGNEILNLKEAAKSPPTGPEVTPPPAQNEGFFSKAKAALLGTSENQEKESNALTKESSNPKEYKVRNINIQSELQLPEYSISLTNANIKMKTPNHKLDSSSQDLSLQTGGEAEIQGFTGTLSWKNSQLMLEGEMKGYKNKNTEVVWKQPEKYSFTLLEGKVSIENTDIPHLAGTSSGPVQIGDKLTLQTEKDQLNIQKYTGSLVSEMKGDQNTLTLKGHAQELGTETNQFNMQLG